MDKKNMNFNATSANPLLANLVPNKALTSTAGPWRLSRGNTRLPRSKEAITACRGRFNRCHNLSCKPKKCFLIKCVC